MFLGGNIQFLSYLFITETDTLFSFELSGKINLILVIVIFFSLLIFCTGAFLIMKAYYGDQIKYLLDNVPTDLKGTIYFGSIFGFRSMLLGFVHAYFDSRYQVKVGMLFFIEISFMTYSFVLLRYKRFFQSKLNVWLSQDVLMARMVLLFTFFFDRETITPRGSVYDQIHMIIIYTFLAILVIAFAAEIISRLA